ncbi:MAG TPA: hypothetical protein VHS31_10995 [Tepidisphaeraceae bacterium]|jgi:hypothetical protein|nr:hypothetical protein [Tepidisphaeraceae bacterium]
MNLRTGHANEDAAPPAFIFGETTIHPKPALETYKRLIQELGS